ncbi:hypothetical protein N9H39_11850 [Gammaproteobacteria bacterium]|jgi:hypothetical protein|nr:hypothetical protein [Gammaproteobacteria bacterium]
MPAAGFEPSNLLQRNIKLNPRNVLPLYASLNTPAAKWFLELTNSIGFRLRAKIQ